MLTTWIEMGAKGRNGGPIRAGMWAAAVIGTHPIEDHQRVWLELTAEKVKLGRIPAYWIENKSGNSYWHAPIPPQEVGVQLHYHSVVERKGGQIALSNLHSSVVRPNLPDRTESPDLLGPSCEGLVGNRRMSVRVDSRGSTYDVYFPTVGLHSNVRPKAGDQPESRSHFRAIVGGLAVGRRLDWFNERSAWDKFQNYSGVTNLLTTELTWRHGPVRVSITDFVAMGECLPRNASQEESPGQYLKRFRIKNEGVESRQALFGIYVHAEINGGVGDLGLSWHDRDQALLAINRGHIHSNRKLARDSTVEFALALDPGGEVEFEPTGPNEAILYRWIELPAGAEVRVDLLVSGAFTGWNGDRGTYEHWLRPALSWFRSVNLDQVEQATVQEWEKFVEPIPSLHFPRGSYSVNLRRSALAAALHVDAKTGAVASGLDRGLSAYCWPRDAIWVGGAFERLGHHQITRGVYNWLDEVRGLNAPFLYWFQKYSIDGMPEWETPAVDQTALIPWGLERHYRRTGDLDFVRSLWTMVEQAARVCGGDSGGHPGLVMLEDLNLISSAGFGDQFFGAFLFSNACAVVGLRAAARLALLVDRPSQAEIWQELADRIWYQGILSESQEGRDSVPGLVDAKTGRFIIGRRLSKLRGLWTSQPEFLIERDSKVDVSALCIAIPFGLLPASDPRLLKTHEVILRANLELTGDPGVLTSLQYDLDHSKRAPVSTEHAEVSMLATLRMIRYLIQLGRETGQGRRWNQAITMFEALHSRLSPLGLSLRPSARGPESARPAHSTDGNVRRLHAMLIETLLDIAGLEYDAADQRLTLQPVLPGQWPQTGATQSFLCGECTYFLERPIGGTVHRLTVETKLRVPVTLEVSMTCPGLTELGPWEASPSTPQPDFQPSTGRVQWSLPLPAGEGRWSWTWG